MKQQTLNLQRAFEDNQNMLDLQDLLFGALRSPSIDKTMPHHALERVYNIFYNHIKTDNEELKGLNLASYYIMAYKAGFWVDVFNLALYLTNVIDLGEPESKTFREILNELEKVFYEDHLPDEVQYRNDIIRITNACMSLFGFADKYYPVMDKNTGLAMDTFPSGNEKLANLYIGLAREVILKESIGSDKIDVKKFEETYRKLELLDANSFIWHVLDSLYLEEKEIVYPSLEW